MSGLRSAAPRHARRLLRHFSGGSQGAMNVFDRELKIKQRDIAAKLEDRQEYDYLHDAIAERVVDRLDDITRKFPTVLDLGCRSGHVCKALCNEDYVWDGEVRGGVKTFVQCDSSSEMVSVATKVATATSVASLELDVHSVVADEEFLPFGPDKFDLVTSNLSLHWVNDLPGSLSQVSNILKPDGVFIGAMLGGETLKELRSALLVAEQEREGGVGIHVSPFAQVADCGNLMQRARFNLPTVDTDIFQIDYPDAFTLMAHLGKMGENNAALGRRPWVSRDTFNATAAIYQELYGNEDGSIPATFQVIYMIGWKPHASQPEPKRRGSAARSFKELEVHKSTD